jgi:hypothetical protein
MTSRSSDPELRRRTEENTAAGIYGVIVGAAVMATTHADSVIQLELAVLVTLVIYWAAERYSRIVAERIIEGRRPSWHEVRQQLTYGWAIVSTSVLPLAVLGVLGLVGVDQSVATLVALLCSTGLLCLAGWAAGRRGQLSPLERVASAATAGAFGLMMILLKAMLH